MRQAQEVLPSSTDYLPPELVRLLNTARQELSRHVDDGDATDFRNSPLSITGIPQGTSGAEGLG